MRSAAGLVARGASTADIAAALQLSPHTVGDRVEAIFDKSASRAAGARDVAPAA